LRTDQEFTLTYESIILLYLTGCLFFLDLNPKFNAKCEVNPIAHTMHFLVIVLWPTVCARLLIYFKLRNASFAQLKSALFYLDAYYYATYGIWTIYQILMLLDLPRTGECSKLSGMSLV